jgi:hypothetical protein
MKEGKLTEPACAWHSTIDTSEAYASTFRRENRLVVHARETEPEKPCLNIQERRGVGFRICREFGCPVCRSFLDATARPDCPDSRASTRVRRQMVLPPGAGGCFFSPIWRCRVCCRVLMIPINPNRRHSAIALTNNTSGCPRRGVQAKRDGRRSTQIQSSREDCDSRHPRLRLGHGWAAGVNRSAAHATCSHSEERVQKEHLISSSLRLQHER